jgi:hypothetical protein
MMVATSSKLASGAEILANRRSGYRMLGVFV